MNGMVYCFNHFLFYNPLIGFTQLLHLFGDMAEIHIILFLILQQTLVLYLQLSQFSPHSLLSVNLPSSSEQVHSILYLLL